MTEQEEILKKLAEIQSQIQGSKPQIQLITVDSAFSIYSENHKLTKQSTRNLNYVKSVCLNFFQLMPMESKEIDHLLANVKRQDNQQPLAFRSIKLIKRTM